DGQIQRPFEGLIVEGSDDGGNGEVQTGRRLELEPICREVDLADRIAGARRDIRQQGAERLNALGAGSARGVISGNRAEIPTKRQLYGSGEIDGDRSGGY